MVTLFTATYNRASLLPKLYGSLLLQTYVCFEWVIVDDGSSDGTAQLIKCFIAENKIAIRYFKQENGGKHRAINKGVAVAQGSLFFMVDSDDYLPYHGINTVVTNYIFAKKKYNISGVAGRRMFYDGKVVGSPAFEAVVSTSIEIRYKWQVRGDLVEVFETQVLKEFPFPEYENENFCPEALVWNRIAQKYTLFFFNTGIYTTAYLADGLTFNIVKIRMKSPSAAMACYSELASFKIPVTQQVRATVNFWRFAFCSQVPFFIKLKKVSFIKSLVALPLGFLLYINDIKTTT